MTDPMDTPPKDYGSDRYDYVEVIGAPEGQTPAGLQWFDALLRDGVCPDCRANLFVYWRTDEQIAAGVAAGASASRWAYRVAHDDGCPTLAKIEAEQS